MRESETRRNNIHREKKTRNRDKGKETEKQRQIVRQRDNNAIQETTDI